LKLKNKKDLTFLKNVSETKNQISSFVAFARGFSWKKCAKN
jgi:hypothetical protein